MTRILSIANQKGGVGKTTTAINLAVGCAKAGSRVLLIDVDPQCNATTGLGIAPAENHPLLSPGPLSEGLVRTTTEGLTLLPGSRRFEDIDRLAGISMVAPSVAPLERIPGLSDRQIQQPHELETDDTRTVTKHLREGLSDYDLVFIDCPPSLGKLTRTALACSHEVLMPIQCEYFAMEGLTQMIQVIRQIMQRPNRQLEFGGILLTMVDHTLELAVEVENEVREFFGEIVFHTVIPRDVAVCEAPSHGCAVLDYRPRARGTRAYIELCMEVLER